MQRVNFFFPECLSTVLVVCSLLLFITSHLEAQRTDKHAIYLAGEIGVGNYCGIDLSLNSVLNHKYSLRIGYSFFLRKPKSLPADFEAGRAFFISDAPIDYLGTAQVCIGKLFDLNENGTTRLNLSTGIGFTIIREPDNWKWTASSGGIGILFGVYPSNYTYEYHKRSALSLIISPKIEFTRHGSSGWTISPMIQTNKYTTYIGVGVGIMIGRM